MQCPRHSGLILHPTALPGPYGMGEIGHAAYTFVDQLKAAGQRLWQILPLVPTGMGQSPYGAESAFGGNPLLIDFRFLMKTGLLHQDEIRLPTNLPVGQVDFDRVVPARWAVLHHVCRHFYTRADGDLLERFANFCERQSFWLDDYALFAALKADQDGVSWTNWPAALRRRDPAALAAARKRLVTAMDHVKICQFLFAQQWSQLRRYCADAGVQILGDLPIFVAEDSADVWVHARMFYLDKSYRPTVVGGVPPDYFSETGQRWGNPLYRWDVMAQQGYAWWIARIRHAFEMVDILRIDHFRGFEAYWEIPAAASQATEGRWVAGPGIAFFRKLKTVLGDLPIVAEDLGHITEPVRQLLAETGYPGMRVAQFSFGADSQDAGVPRDRRPHTYPVNALAYTGTHDNNTTLGWYTEAFCDEVDDNNPGQAHERQALLDYLVSDGRELHWDVMRCVWQSPALAAIAPVQDVLGLGAAGRFNTPGVVDNNWNWRLLPDQLTPAHLRRLRRLTAETGRLNEDGA